MKKIIFYLVGMLAVAACTHSQKSQNGNANYKQELWQKVSDDVERDMQAARKPATGETALSKLKIDINDLRKDNKSFKMYVFPKISSMTKKTHEEDTGLFLTKPLVMDVSTKYAASCAFFFKGGHKKLNPVKYFPAAYKNEKNRTCVILEITSEKVKDLAKPLLRDGDELRKRIYFDESYAIFGIETDFYAGYAGDVELKTIGAKYDGVTSVSSGLGLIPAELAALDTIGTVIATPVSEIFADSPVYEYDNEKTVVDAVAVNQIKRLNQKYEVPNCQLNKVTYKDSFARWIRSYWCQGAAWPQVVDTPAYLVVTESLK